MDSLNYLEKLANQDRTIITRLNELFENKRNSFFFKHYYNDLKQGLRSKLLKDGAKKSLHDTLELILNRCLPRLKALAASRVC